MLRVARNTAPAAHIAHRSHLGRSNWPIADDTRVPQSEALLVNMRKRRRALNRHIGLARCLSNQSGWLQLYQFELQGLQLLMQSDAMRLEVLMSAYKQREKMHEVQMTEARRVSDTKRTGAASMDAVRFTPGTAFIA